MDPALVRVTTSLLQHISTLLSPVTGVSIIPDLVRTWYEANTAGSEYYKGNKKRAKHLKINANGRLWLPNGNEICEKESVDKLSFERGGKRFYYFLKPILDLSL